MSFREIENITNVTASAVLDATGAFAFYGNIPPADEVVIRQITYCSDAVAKYAYLVRSSFGIVGTVVNTTQFVSNPGTRIRVREQLFAPLQFQLLLPAGAGGVNAPTNASSDIGDMISISMDFIKYRN